MLSDRQEYEPLWLELRNQFAPSRGRFTVYEKAKRDIRRQNSVPRQVPDDFAAGMKSGLTSPSRPWFTLTLFDNALMDISRVKNWLSKIQDIMQGTMIRSNLYDQLFDLYKEQGIFGTGALYVDEDDADVFFTRCMTIGTYLIGVDSHRRVNRFGRTLTFTARQLVDEFGEDAVPQEIRMTLSEADNRTQYEVRHLVEPNTDFMPDEAGKNGMKYRSLYWLAGYNEPEFLRNSGYHEFPVMVPRWRIIGEDIYGREQPGEMGLDDARTIQDLEADERDAIKKGVSPPVVGPAGVFDGILHDYPRGVTLYDPIRSGGTPMFTPLYNVHFDHQSAAAKRVELINRLQEAFYVNFFRMWSSDMKQGRTATEIQVREAEKMYMLGPLIERQMSEMLDPLITRIFAIMNRRGMFPPVPPELDGKDVKIEYTSILANMQKQAAQAGIQIVLETAGQLANLQSASGEPPAVLDNVNYDEVIRQLGEMHAIPPDILHGEDAVLEKRRAREAQMQEAAAQAQMQQATAMGVEAAPQLAGAMKDMSETSVNGQSALDGLAEAAQQLTGAGGGEPGG